MSGPVRVLVVDDEAPARRKLARLLADVPDVALAGEAETGPEAVDRIRALAPDLVLLDVQMPGLDGFGVVAAVGVGATPPVVFVPAHDEHALRAFEVRALDYLLKPVTAERLHEALDRVRSRAHGPAADAARAARLLPVDDIELARAERNYVALHTPFGAFRVRGTVGELAERLDPARFLRVNRSDVVRLDAIRELQPWSHGDYRIVLRDGTALLWSRRFRAEQAGSFELGS